MVVILTTIIPYGAVNPFWFYFAVLLNGIVFTGTLAIPFRNVELLKVYKTALAVILLTGVYLLAQSVQFSQNTLANPIWTTVRDLLKIEGGAVSVNPGATIAAIPVLLHPFLIFMAALVLHQNDDTTVPFFRLLALVGAGIAVFGLVQHTLFPRSLLMGEKIHYLDSVVGTFVNRNSAAAFFGVAALLLVGVLVRQFQQLYPYRDQSRFPLQQDRRKHQTSFICHAALFIAVLLALFMTGSRGGLVATFIPLLLIAAWFGYSVSPSTASMRRRVGFAGSGIAILSLLFAILGARSLFRIEQGGVDDARWCVFRSTIEAIRDNPWYGTGFGTFEDVFPVYRNPECGLGGVWDRAHNSFLEGYLGMGLPFALLLVIVFAYLLRIFLIGYRSRRRFRIVPLIGMGTLLLIVIHSMLDFSLQIPGVAAYVAAALAAAVSVSLARVHSARATDLR